MNRLLHRFNGNLTSSKSAKIEKTSPATALRDISDLVARGTPCEGPGREGAGQAIRRSRTASHLALLSTAVADQMFLTF
jgi:hypothetical protein